MDLSDTHVSAMSVAENHGAHRGAALRIGISIALLLSVVYVPYVLHGGFVYDDWDICYRADVAGGFWQTFRDWFPVFSIRPLAPLLLAATGNLFHWWEPGYVATTLVLFGVAVAALGKTFGRYFGRRFVLLFTLLIAFPSMCSTLIFNPGMQIVGTSTLLLWSLSLLLIDRSTRQARPFGTLVVAHGLILVALLIYELILPLLIISMLWPLVVMPGRQGPWWRRIDRAYLLRYVLPVIAVIVAIAIFQGVILPQITTRETRMRLNLSNSLASVASWYFAVGLQYPGMLLESVRHTATALQTPWTAGAVLVLLLVIGWGFYRWPEESAATDRASNSSSELNLLQRQLLLIVGLSFLAGSTLYFFTGMSAVVWGFSNRGMTPTWVTMALWCAMFFERHRTSRFWQGVAAALIVLNLLAFVVQRNNYLAGWQLQQAVIADLAQQAEAAAVPRDSIVIGNVPSHLTNSYNDEFIFRSELDFGIGARVATKGRFRAGTVVANETIAFGILGDIDAQSITLRTTVPLQVPYEELWYYEYDQVSSQSRLLQVRDEPHLRELLDHVQHSGVNDYSEPFLKPYFENIRDLAKSIVRESRPAPSPTPPKS